MAVEEMDQEPQSETDSHIRVQDLEKRFGDLVACTDINLDISRDEFVVLVGPSGCGKTTTLRCLAGLEIPDDGIISISGEDVTHNKPKDRDIAFVFQDIILYPHMSVRENIMFGLNMKTDLSEEEKDQRVQNVAEMLGIGEYLDSKPKALSGGQQQRVSLGRAMVMQPAAFLLDEPFSALDANLRDKLRTEVKKLQRELETPMIFVTHDQEEAITLGDKIVVMNDGAIEQIGTSYEIYNEPANLFVATFIGSPTANLFECEVLEDDRVQCDIFTIDFPSDAFDRNLPVGDQVSLGIRPEYIEFDTEPAFFEAEVSVVEPHGERDVVHLTADDTEFTAVTHQKAVDQSADRVSVSFSTDEVWLFDSAGDRIVRRSRQTERKV